MSKMLKVLKMSKVSKILNVTLPYGIIFVGQCLRPLKRRNRRVFFPDGFLRPADRDAYTVHCSPLAAMLYGW